MPTIEKTDHLTRLDSETIDAEGRTCPECHETGPGEKLFIFSTVMGRRVRVHDGAFCSKACHDRWHGLKPRGWSVVWIKDRP